MIVHHLCESIFVTRHKNQSQQVFSLEIDACVLFSGYTADMHTRQLGSLSSARLENATTLSIHVDHWYSHSITRSLIGHRCISTYTQYANEALYIGFVTNHCCRKASPFPSYNMTKTTPWHDWSVTVYVLHPNPHRGTHYETHVYVILFHRFFAIHPAFSPSQATQSRNCLAAIPVFLISI